MNRKQLRAIVAMAQENIDKHEKLMQTVMGDRFTPLSRKARKRWIQQVIDGCEDQDKQGRQ